jgi:hypothetical protein
MFSCSLTVHTSGKEMRKRKQEETEESVSLWCQNDCEGITKLRMILLNNNNLSPISQIHLSTSYTSPQPYPRARYPHPPSGSLFPIHLLFPLAPPLSLLTLSRYPPISPSLPLSNDNDNETRHDKATTTQLKTTEQQERKNHNF